MVGVHVVLDIVPQHIDAAAWVEAFEETRVLLEAHPARLLGYGFRLAAGVRVPMFTRSVVQGGDDPEDRRWCVVGDRTTLATGERQRMYRDLGRYLARCRPSRMEGAAELSDDILTSPAEGPPTTVRVFGEGGQSEPCRLALLAAAMVVETCFPRSALVSGHFDREQAEAARRWAKGILGRAIALPVRVDAWRLVERLGSRLAGEALVQAVDRLYLAEHPSLRAAALLGVFGRAEAEPWFTAKLREHAGQAGALHLAAAYLDATRDPARLAWLACLDPRGPRLSPEAFVASLATLTDPRGAPRPRLDDATLEHALGVVFGDAAARLTEAYRAARCRAGALELTGESLGESSCAAIRATEESPAPDAGAPFASTASPSELDATQRESIHALARAVRDVQRALEESGGAVSAAAARRTVTILLSRRGPTLTEEAWEWIEREDDLHLCTFLAALATFEPPDAASAALRRALLESRTLCRYAAGVSRGGQVSLPDCAMVGGCA